MVVVPFMKRRRIVVTQLAYEDFAGSGFEIVRAVRQADPEGIDIDQLVVRKTAFGIPCGPTLGELGVLAAQARLDRTDILHFKGDYVHRGSFVGMKLPAGAKRIYTVGGTFFRRGGPPEVSKGQTPLEEYQADLRTALTPDLCYTPEWIWTPHPWTEFDYRWRRGERFRVVHLPSAPAKKGSELVTAALARVRARRGDVEYETASGLPHGEALALKRRAHLVIDQMLLPVYGVAAVEALAAGIPVVNWLEGYYGRIPVCTPRTRTAEALAELIDGLLDWDVLEKLSRETFRYAQQTHGRAGRFWAGVYRRLAAGRSALGWFGRAGGLGGFNRPGWPWRSKSR
jgi:hypothetical protein